MVLTNIETQTDNAENNNTLAVQVVNMVSLKPSAELR